ncbi:malto-oligosyltrehalose trehalohydrolase [Cellulomonas denverensis]|uniref:Malto-oligosyltrehalose trehalohydrolase n=1 Tax=Cellulomonas denverensis TaxID=264297 RepID=A0A7X6QZS0_9CELL|nr:malto-oligosyltrehalose trehalohydrolase [Cellulomonas denverensis]NKY23366.1 malto-oligosyltrehalose trehalohydrolase [Cellulomonas denverensis]GIG24344.1 malto-oligosyltrehalose trehalohydrolase [Cellulomonas denverensis]
MRVWAPQARTVELVLPGPDEGGDERLALDPGDGGWWAGAHDLPHGTDYALSLDGGPPRPDPRSPWQPEGVHGPSRVFDAGRFDWADGAWAGRDVRGAVIYELHVGTFTAEGTLDAAIPRLGHLADLGVEVVELLPVAPFNGRHGWGYDGVSLYGVHQPYGGPAALQRFVDAAHRAGLAVCLDVVHNHLGPSGNYLAEFGPYFTDAHQTPWGAAINLGEPEVRRWIIDSALRWLRDFHVDALRLDAVHALVDDTPRHVLAELADAVAALATDLGRPLSLIAETDLNDPVSITPTAEGGWGMTAQWADDVHHAVHALLTGERQGYYVDFGSPETLAHAMTRVFVHEGGHSTFRGRDWGRPVPDGVDGHRFVVFGSDHDQVGNRALGDRPSDRLDDDALAAEAALIVLSPFTPMLFMGEEWGARTPWLFVTDHPEPELAEAVRQGRSAEFGSHGWATMYGRTDDEFTVPDPQAAESLERSRLDWAEPALPGHRRLYDWYRRLIALRREVDDLGSGDRSRTALTWDPAAEGSGGTAEDHSPEAARDRAWRSWLVLHRGDARVVINLSGDEQTVPLSRTGSPQVLAAWAAGGARVLTDEDGARVVVPGHTVVVLR